jgi:hypothetical protein
MSLHFVRVGSRYEQIPEVKEAASVPRPLVSIGTGREVPEFERLAREVSEHTSLERLLEWGRAQRPVRRVDEIVTQDEYTHDVLLPLEEPFVLAYDVT